MVALLSYKMLYSYSNCALFHHCEAIPFMALLLTVPCSIIGIVASRSFVAFNALKKNLLFIGVVKNKTMKNATGQLVIQKYSFVLVIDIVRTLFSTKYVVSTPPSTGEKVYRSLRSCRCLQCGVVPLLRKPHGV